MKLTRQALSSIRAAAGRVDIQVGKKQSKVNGEEVIDYNLLVHDDATMDLYDMEYWSFVRTNNFTEKDGFCLLDFYLYNHERDGGGLLGNIQALIDKHGNAVRVWGSWHNDDELKRLMETHDPDALKAKLDEDERRRKEFIKAKPKLSRTQKEIQTDTNNCVVHAVAHVMDMPYEEAHEFCRKRGREHRKGTYPTLMFGLTHGKKVRVVKGNRVSFKRLKRGVKMETFRKRNPKGRFILCQYRHAVSLVDGTFQGIINNGIIKSYIRVTPVKSKSNGSSSSQS